MLHLLFRDPLHGIDPRPNVLDRLPILNDLVVDEKSILGSGDCDVEELQLSAELRVLALDLVSIRVVISNVQSVVPRLDELGIAAIGFIPLIRLKFLLDTIFNLFCLTNFVNQILLNFLCLFCSFFRILIKFFLQPLLLCCFTMMSDCFVNSVLDE